MIGGHHTQIVALDIGREEDTENAIAGHGINEVTREVFVPRIGFDDFDLAGVLAPPLTVIAQSPVELARRATSLLFEQIQADQKTTARMPAKILLPVELKIRSSCGC